MYTSVECNTLTTVNIRDDVPANNKTFLTCLVQLIRVLRQNKFARRVYSRISLK